MGETGSATRKLLEKSARDEDGLAKGSSEAECQTVSQCSMGEY